MAPEFWSGVYGPEGGGVGDDENDVKIFWQLEMLLGKKCILNFFINFEIFCKNSPVFANRKVPPRLLRQRSQQKGGFFFKHQKFTRKPQLVMKNQAIFDPKKKHITQNR